MPAIRAANDCSWSELTGEYGDPLSDKVFRMDDFRMYLFNEHVGTLCKTKNSVMDRRTE